MGAVGDAVAHDFARLVAVVAHAEHAGREDRNVALFTSRFRRACANFLLGPFIDAEIETGAEDDAVGGAAGELQTFWAFREKEKTGQAGLIAGSPGPAYSETP